MRKPRIYIESSVVSYLVARPSRDPLIHGKQKLTKIWWLSAEKRFERYISEFVIKEIRGGDRSAAEKRVNASEGLELLPLLDEAIALAHQLIDKGPLPEKAAIDAFHIAVAASHQVDYLVTWNCTHIANAAMRTKIIELVQKSGFKCPVICTPEELMGDESDGS